MVEDAGGQPVPGATVFVSEPPGAQVSFRAGRDGLYRITLPSRGGTFEVTARSAKETASQSILVPALIDTATRPGPRYRAFVVNLAFGHGKARQGAALIPIYFATDRERLAGGPLDYIDALRQPRRLRLGVATVSVPLRHEIAALERPRLWEFLSGEDVDRHVVVRGGRDHSYADFYAEIARRAKAGPTSALVFVHGYRVTFEEALLQTAQLVFDLRFQGVPILYSWPSGHFTKDYIDARTRVGDTAPRLRWFLEDVATRVPDLTVHVAAHSLGSEATARALARMEYDPSPARPSFGQVIFAAPDVLVNEFAEHAKFLTRRAARTTAYSSEHDLALRLARELQAGLDRAGEKPLTVPGVDGVDASRLRTDLVAHSYYARHVSIISDMIRLLCRSESPPQRGLQGHVVGGGRYWTPASSPAAIPAECLARK